VFLFLKNLFKTIYHKNNNSQFDNAKATVIIDKRIKNEHSGFEYWNSFVVDKMS